MSQAKAQVIWSNSDPLFSPPTCPVVTSLLNHSSKYKHQLKESAQFLVTYVKSSSCLLQVMFVLMQLSSYVLLFIIACVMCTSAVLTSDMIFDVFNLPQHNDCLSTNEKIHLWLRIENRELWWCQLSHPLHDHKVCIMKTFTVFCENCESFHDANFSVNGSAMSWLQHDRSSPGVMVQWADVMVTIILKYLSFGWANTGSKRGYFASHVKVGNPCNSEYSKSLKKDNYILNKCCQRSLRSCLSLKFVMATSLSSLESPEVVCTVTSAGSV